MIKLKINIMKLKKLSTENKELYGSVKPTEISKVLEEIDNVKINPSLIQPSKEIKSIGDFEVLINLTLRSSNSDCNKNCCTRRNKIIIHNSPQ